MVQRERTHDREKERRNRRKRKYGQAKMKHAKRGIISCVLAAGVFLLLVGMLAKAYVSGGQASSFVGGLAILTLLLAGNGLYMGVKGFKEREKNYLTCKIGIGCNGVFILSFIMIFIRGLF